MPPSTEEIFARLQRPLHRNLTNITMPARSACVSRR